MDADFVSLEIEDSFGAISSPSSKPLLPNLSSNDSDAPWETDYSIIPSPLFKLHEEILDFCHFVSPTIEEQTARFEVIDQITGLVLSLWPNAEVKTFGSMATKLYLPTSDIDLVILGVSSDKKSFLLLESCLKSSNLTSYLEAVLNARIPIIKLTHRASAFSVDISIDVKGAPEAAAWFTQEIARRPVLRPLTLLLKCFLYARELHETYHGGVGSFALQLMILSFLQMLPPNRSSRPSCLGSLFLMFLRYYGNEFNFVKVGISVNNNGSLFLKTNYHWFDSNRPFLLSIENPFDSTMDVGRNSYHIIKVRRAFAVAYSALLAAMTFSSTSSSSSSSSVSLLRQLLPLHHPVYTLRRCSPRTLSVSSSASSSALDSAVDSASVEDSVFSVTPKSAKSSRSNFHSAAKSAVKSSISMTTAAASAVRSASATSKPLRIRRTPQIVESDCCVITIDNDMPSLKKPKHGKS